MSGWRVWDVDMRTQPDDFQCGIHTIHFAHLFRYLTAPAAEARNMAPPRGVTTAAGELNTPREVLQALRSCLGTLTATSVRDLRGGYVSLIAEAFPGVHEFPAARLPQS